MAGSTSSAIGNWVIAGLLAVLALHASPLMAQPITGDACRLLAHRGPVWRAATPLARDEVRLTFVGHATFLIESPQGITIETDYNDYVRSGRVPVIATMNKAHSTHFSFSPDPAIAHVLRGWSDVPDTPVVHNLAVGDVRLRNVSTNIRSFRGTEVSGNSIFVFEVAGLCIAHLGHLHHPLEPAQIQAIGRVDVLLVPVDGSWTLDLPGMVDVVRHLSPTILIPMHYFNPWTLKRFVEQVRDEWLVEERAAPELIVSRTRLPEKPRMIILPGR